MNVNELLDTIEDLLEESTGMPLSGGKRIVDVEQIRDYLDDIRANLPVELRQAQSIVGDRAQLIESANAQAQAIVKKAEERARIQTFPGTFKFSGNKTDKEQMIGNAVPVNLARFVGETINEYVRFNEDKQREEPINTYDPYRANHPTQLSIFEPQAEYIPKQDKNCLLYTSDAADE